MAFLGSRVCSVARGGHAAPIIPWILQVPDRKGKTKITAEQLKQGKEPGMLSI